MSSDPSLNPQEVEQTKQQIRGLVEEISKLAAHNLSLEDYYAEFLKRLVEALAAVGGAIWTFGEGNELLLSYQINLQRTMLDVEGEHQLRHARLLGSVIQTGEGLLVPPHSGSGNEDEGANPTELLLVLAPLKSLQKIEAVVEIFQRPTPQPATRRGYLRFVTQMCELAGEWLKTYKLRELTHRESMWRAADAFARSVHESLDVRLTAYNIANEAQRFIGCDRASVALMSGRRCRIEAVSGQDTFDNRSNVITLLGTLATQVTRSGDSIWYAGTTENMLPQIEDAVHDYVDESHSKTVAVFPLYKTVLRQPQPESEGEVDPICIGALIVEQIEDLRPAAELTPRIDFVCGHADRALTNALEHHGLFLMPVWRAIGKSRVLVKARTLPKTIAVLLAILAVSVGLVVIPKNFDLEGRGVLQPALQHQVFVATEGVVKEVNVEHGDLVKQGDVLVELRNTDLELRLADILGQQRSSAEQVASIERMRHDAKLPRDEVARLSGQLSQLKQRLAMLTDQYAILVQKREQLLIRSAIDGQIVTWNLKRQLLQRPVAAGQALITVADPSGPWELEVYVPENRMGHVTAAQAELGRDLDVNYIVATEPTIRCKGKLKSIHNAAELHEHHGQAVRAMVEIDQDELRDPRPGATVTARIHCGQRPIGYVWLHDLFEFIQSRVLFRL